MTFTQKIRHWFTPRSSNNFRARLLHNSSIFVMLGIVIFSSLALRFVDTPSRHILGYTSSITVDEVVRSTNEIRAAAGLRPLAYNEKLADAARRKAANMFSENYWAHNSPSGLTPWTWFKAAGYTYLFAGENLAKDFGDTSRMMNAWMNSPTHKDNIVNPKYKEIGIAVVPGSIGGSDTVLVVQLFGAASSGSVAPQVAEVKGKEIEAPAAKVAEMMPSPTPAPSFAPMPQAQVPSINQFDLAKSLNLLTSFLFIVALIIDLVLAESQKLSRRVGNNWSHIIFLNIILLALMIVSAGRII